jgi:hypothetical protein
MVQFCGKQAIEEPLRWPHALFDEWRVMNPIGNKRAPKHTQRFIDAKAGLPKRRETHGNGTPIGDVKGTTPFQRDQRGSP